MLGHAARLHLSAQPGQRAGGRYWRQRFMLRPLVPLPPVLCGPGPQTPGGWVGEPLGLDLHALSSGGVSC